MDAVTLFDEDTPRELIAEVLPDVLIKGADWSHFIAGREEVEAAGGQVLTVALEPGYSTTNIVERILQRNLDSSRRSRSVSGLGAASRLPGCAAPHSRPAATPRFPASPPPPKRVYSVLLWQIAGRPLIIVVDGNKQAEALTEAVNTFFDLLAPDDRNGPQLLPALDVLPLQNLSPHAEICEQRAIGLWSLATQRVPITILPVASALLRIEPADFYRQLALQTARGEELPLEEVVAHLESIGYERREPVEMVGEYSVRGGILDVFSPESAEAGPHRPVRRPGRIHPPLRCGVPALRAQGRGLPATAVDGIPEDRAPFWRNCTS